MPIDVVLLSSLAINAALATALMFVGQRLRRQSRAALDWQKAREALLASAPTAPVLIGADETVRFVSPGLSSAWSFRGSGLQHLSTMFADGAALARATRQLLRGSAVEPMELPTADGRGLYRISGAPLPEGAVLWFADIRATRAAEAGRAAETARLAQAREDAEGVLTALPLPAWRRDRDLRLAWVNRAYAATVGRAPEDAVGGNHEIVSGLVPGQARTLAAQARESGEPRHELRNFVVDGERRTFLVTERPLGPSETIVGWAQDVTERETLKAELALRDSAHREVLGQLGTGIAIYGKDKHLAYSNAAFARLWHLDEDWLAGEPHASDVLDRTRANGRLPEPPNYAAFIRERLARFTDLIEQAEEILHLPDGTTVLRALVAPHPFGGLIEIYEDVTDTVALERKYNEQIAVQRRTLDNLYEGVSVWGSDGRLRLFNSAYAQIWGLDPATLEEAPHVAEVLEAQRQLLDDGGAWDRTKAETIAEITGGHPRSGRHLRVDGTVIDYAYVPLPDGALLATYIDVTDSQRKEEALRERNAALEAADQLKSEFITNVSYQLRTPLTTIIGFGEMLKYGFFGALNDRQQGYIANILDSANQLLELIDNILDLAMIEAGQMTLEREPFELGPMLGAMVQLVGDSARKRNQKVQLDQASEIGWIDADQRRVKQVLFNLLTNAIKYTPPGGTVTLGARRVGDEIELAVTDTGVGIAPEERAQMFGKFTTGSRTSRTAGAGLGLALVKNFIELHGGSVNLDTPPDGGTRVICRLPATAAS